jgi:uncharacterized protein YndB with AHSA1/START domain
VAARPETVFRYFTEAKRFSEWVGAAVELTPEVGGNLRIDFSRHQTVVVGDIVEIIPDRKIVFTWGVEAGPQANSIPPGSTTVAITLEPRGSGTLVTLRHSGLPSEQERRNHEGGWTFYLSQLSRVTIEAEIRRHIDQRVEAFLSAWSETDSSKRLDLLKNCWAEDGVFLDRYGSVVGRDPLHAYIGGAQKMMPGMTISRVGEIHVSHDHVWFAWEGKDEQGNPAGKGQDFCSVTPEGRITKMVGFWD